MILRSKVLVSVLAAAAAVAACQSSDGEPVTGGAGAPAAGAGAGTAGAGHAAGSKGDAGAAPVGDAGAGGEPSGHAGSGGHAAHAGDGNSGGATAGADNGGNAGGSEAGSGGEAGTENGGSSGEGGTPDGPSVVAYVGTILGGVFACSVDPVSGAPTKLGDAIAKNSFVAALAVDSQQHFLYVAQEQKHLDVYRIAADGSLPAQPDSTIATPDTLNTLTLDPLGRFAYAGSVAGRAIYGYTIDADSGALSSMGEPIVVGNETQGGANYLVADPTGHFLYVSNAFGGGITGFTIAPTTGALTVIPGSPFGAVGLPGGHNVFGGAIAIKPSGDFLYSVGGALNAFAIAADGKLDLVAGSPFTLDVQSDPDASNLAIDPQGAYLYTTHFLGNNHIHGFKIDPGNGSLAAVPSSPITGTAPYSVAVDPSGRFLYVGVDDANGLDAYTIQRSTGAPTRVDGSLFAIGGLEPAIAFAKLGQ
ncbi:MAG: beta-propeller fold lactonase family protein [Polyangiaceae bacterium]